MGNNSKAGILLVGFGIFLMLNQLNIFSGLNFLVFLGVGFLVAYVLAGARKNYGNIGFLIPGLVLLALAGFAGGEVSRNPSLFFLFLSFAFWAMFLIHTFWFTAVDWGARFWPVFPGAGLMLFSGMLYAITVLDWDLWGSNLWNYILAVVLILIGIRLLFKKGA
jgi:hypothetical protein